MATTPKQKAFWIIVGLAVIIAGASIWYFFFRDDCDPNKKGYTKKGKISDKCFGEAQDPKTINTVINPPPAGCQWTSDDTFPLKRCMSGNKVKALQTALGITADGKFGNQTEGAVKAKFSGRSEVTQPEYNALINPPATGGGSNFSNLKKDLGDKALDFSGGVYVDNVLGKNDTYKFNFFTNGRFFIYKQGDTEYWKKGTYSNGGKKMVIDIADGGGGYEKGNVWLNMKEIMNSLG